MTTDACSPPRRASIWVQTSLVLAVAGLAGSLLLSLGMRLKACPLCFYQRTFMMSIVAVLGMGLLAGVPRRSRMPRPLTCAGRRSGPNRSARPRRASRWHGRPSYAYRSFRSLAFSKDA
jgi:hypothetical protein